MIAKEIRKIVPLFDAFGSKRVRWSLGHKPFIYPNCHFRQQNCAIKRMSGYFDYYPESSKRKKWKKTQYRIKQEKFGTKNRLWMIIGIKTRSHSVSCFFSVVYYNFKLMCCSPYALYIYFILSYLFETLVLCIFCLLSLVCKKKLHFWSTNNTTIERFVSFNKYLMMKKKKMLKH